VTVLRIEHFIYEGHSLKQTPKSSQNQADALEALGDKVKSAQKARAPDLDEEASGWAVGINYASVFTGAVIVGGAFGYGFDYLVGTKPWGLMAGIILGFAAGTRSVVQMAKSMMDEDGVETGGKDAGGES